MTLSPQQRANNLALRMLCLLLQRLDPGACGAPTSASPSGSAPATVEVHTAAREAVARLDVTAPVPTIGPRVALNRWKFIPVGYPVWLTANHPDQPTRTNVSHQGLTITITLGAPSYTWTLGDGTTTTCTTMTTWQPRTDQRILPSPDCGHTYQKKGIYDVTLTTSWPVTWTSGTDSGTLTLTVRDTTTIPVGELHAVVVG